jgi:hypothetical protein
MDRYIQIQCRNRKQIQMQYLYYRYNADLNAALDSALSLQLCVAY